LIPVATFSVLPSPQSTVYAPATVKANKLEPCGKIGINNAIFCSELVMAGMANQSAGRVQLVIGLFIKFLSYLFFLKKDVFRDTSGPTLLPYLALIY
jgi:hypothetical protein